MGKKQLIQLATQSHMYLFLRHVQYLAEVFFHIFYFGCESWAIKKASTEELMLLNCGIGEYS